MAFEQPRSNHATCAGHIRMGRMPGRIVTRGVTAADDPGSATERGEAEEDTARLLATAAAWARQLPHS